MLLIMIRNFWKGLSFVGKKVKSKIFGQQTVESLLTYTYLISNPWQEVANGNLNQRNRIIHMIVCGYLLQEVLRIIYWSAMPAEDPISLFTGSYFANLGTTGKVIYITIIAATFKEFIIHVVMLYQEKKGQLDFLFVPQIFQEKMMAKKVLRKMSAKVRTFSARSTKSNHSHHSREFLDEEEVQRQEQEVMELYGTLDQDNPHVKQFLKHSRNLRMTVNFERRNLALTTNGFVAFTAILCIKKYGTGYAVNFFLGWLTHVINKIYVVNGSVAAACYWRTALSFLHMRLLIIKDRIQDVLDDKVQLSVPMNDSENPVPGPSSGINPSTSKISHIIQELNAFQIQVHKFDKCMRGFLLSSFVSFTPIFCTLVHCIFFADFGEGSQLLPTLLAIMMPVYMMQQVIPMYDVAKVWATSHTLYSPLQQICMKTKGLTTKDRLKLLKWMKGVTDDDHPLAPLTITAEPLTPHHFFLYVMELIMNFLQIIEVMRELKEI